MLFLIFEAMLSSDIAKYVRAVKEPFRMFSGREIMNKHRENLKSHISIRLFTSF